MKSVFIVFAFVIGTLFALWCVNQGAYFYWQTALRTAPAEIGQARCSFGVFFILLLADVAALPLMIIDYRRRRRTSRQGFPVVGRQE